MRNRKFTHTQVVAAVAALAAAVFLIDISIPLGVAGGVPYVAVVLVSLWSPKKSLVIYVALLCLLLTIAGYYLSPAGGELWKVFANRLIALFAIWVTALLGIGRRRAEDELKKSRDKLEERVEQRTEELRAEIKERRHTEEVLKESEQKFSSLFDNMLNGFAYHKIVLDEKNRPVDYIFLNINSFFESLTGLKRESIIGKRVTEVIPGIEESQFDWIGEYGKVATEGVELRTEQYFEPLDKWYYILAFSTKPGYFAAVFEDITERKRSVESLKESEALLAEAQKIAHLGHWRLNVETQEITGSDELFRIFGFSREEADLAAFIEVVHPGDRARDLAAITRGMEYGENWSIEHRLVCKDGTEKSVYAVGEARVDETGKITLLVGTIQDITERKRAEQALAESEERFALAMQGASDGLWDWDLQINKIYFSPRWKSMLGYDDKELENSYETWEGLVHPDDIESAKEAIDDYLTGTAKKYEVEFRMRHKDGTWVDILSRGFGVRSQADGKPIRFVGTHVDITGRKRVEEELSLLSARYQAMLTAIPDIIMEVDENKIYKWANHAGRNFFGEGVVGKEASYYFEGEQDTYDIVRPLFHGEEDVIYLESWQRRKDSEKRLLAWWCRVLKDDDGNVTGVLSSARDITEQKQAEQELKKSETRFRSVFESKMIGNLFWDAEGRITDANDAFLEMVGYTRDDLLSGTVRWTEMTPPEYKEQDEKALQEIATTGVIIPIEKEFFRKDGSRVPVLLGGASLPGSAAGSTVGGIAYIVDISERKRSEEAMRAQDKRFRSVLENSPAVIFIKDLDGHHLYVNHNFEEIFHFNQQDVIGKLDSELFSEEIARAVRINDLKVIEASRPMEFEEVIPHDEGLHTYISIKFPLYDESGVIEAVCGIATDITERIRLEQESLKAQKLESIGVLAGGIAHDFNNLLTGIIGNLSLVENMVDEGDAAYRRLLEVEKAAMQASSLTQQLLTFSKGGQPIKSTLSVGELVNTAANFALRGSNVRCVCCPVQDDLWSVDADEGQLSQVVNNLTINADQAMPNGGELKVCSQNQIVKEGSGLPLQNGRYVKVTFMDNGPGIPEDLLPKIFDPYFTTKQKGSGLGLASSYSVIRRHGGHMEVSSRVGVGTTFIIYLPASEEEIVAEKAQEEPVSALPGGRILVMDDEEIVRDVATELLTHLGYEVGTAQDGNEALRLYKEGMEAGEPFGLVIMDITIQGGIGGRECVKMLLEMDPDAKAIVSSGYSNDPIMARYKEFGFVDVIAKPYRVTTLGKKVGRAFKEEKD